MKLVLASNNQKKLAELSAILAPMGYEVITQAEAGVLGEAEETGATFMENARLKARYALERTGLPAVADDSGLEVDALKGAPGIYSARYCEGSDHDRVEKLLSELASVPDGDRGARFVSAIALLFPDGREVTALGACDGMIARAPAGTGGFGYDPVFFVPELCKTFSELSPEEKNRISHRGRALRELEKKLGDRLC